MMNLRTLILLVIVLAMAALAALNFNTLSAATPVFLGLTVVEAPLGLIMLALTALLGIFFLVYVLYMQSRFLLEARQHAKEMRSQRELAERMESSRLAELRIFLEAEAQRVAARDQDGQTALLTRLERLERELQLKLEHSGNTLAAYIGELEDRLERREDSPRPPGHRPPA